VPELPEVEITARRLNSGLAGARIESALAPGLVALKTFDPPLDGLAGLEIAGVRRIGKMLALDAGGLTLLVHLMSAGRLQLFDKRASLRDRASRVLVRIEDGRELRLREFGTQQRAWAKLLRSEAVGDDESVATLGPDALPAPPPEEFAQLLDQPRHLHPLLRDQRTIAGIGRSWVDELLWTARLSPFQKGADLAPDQTETLRGACDEVLGGAIDHYERVLDDVIPDKLPMPLQVHRRAGEDCPRCGTRIEAIHFKDYVMCYCPEEQTGGRVLKDRRLSRLLK
jgi:formamidopyrimidine-DNA glycosylase